MIEPRAELGNQSRPCHFPYLISQEAHQVPGPVLIYSRFPRALMTRIGERYDLLETGGKPANEVFAPEQLASVRALVTAGSTTIGAVAMDRLPALGAIVCYGTGYD